jgi:excinuclease ABC subunit C
MKLEDLKKFKLPDNPGVYFFQKGDEILYIGKATELKSRVRSYFSADLIKTRGAQIVDMVFKADTLRWEVTDSILESLILEANLIKKHQPYYNVREKDDKSWNYVVITREKLPRLLVIRGKELENFASSSFSSLRPSQGHLGGTLGKLKIERGSIFGPFTNGGQLREALKIVRKIFPYLDGKTENYYKFYKQVHLVPDIETGEGIKLYKKNIKHLKLFFEGKKKKVLRSLEIEMHKYAKTREFEKAGEVKRQIFALEHINDVALLKAREDEGGRRFRIEAYDIAHMGGKNMVGVMTVVLNGHVLKEGYRKFKIKTQENTNDTGALREVLDRRFAHSEWPYPDLIVVDGGIAQVNIAEKVMIEAGLPIPIVSVLKDERHKPKNILGDKGLAIKHEPSILLANAEAHRFAITFHKLRRGKSFLPKR